MKEGESHRKLKLSGKIAVASTMSVIIASGEIDGDPLAIPQLAEDYMREVPRLVGEFTQPSNCREDIGVFQNGFETLSEKNAAVKEKSGNIHELAQKAADNAGFHLADETPFLKNIENSESFEEVLEELNAYGINHSLSFTIPEKSSIRHFPIIYSLSSHENLSLAELKLIASETLSTLYFIPTEVTDFAKINDIMLVNSIEIPTYIQPLRGEGGKFVKNISKQEKKNNGPAGIYNPVTRNIFIATADISNGQFSYRLRHELAHAVLFNYCGVMGSLGDEEFSRLNPEGFKYSNEDSLQQFPQVSSSDFGYESVYEDAAFITADYIFSARTLLFNTLSNTEREKISLTISRIDEIAPGYAKYWKNLKFSE